MADQEETNSPQDAAAESTGDGAGRSQLERTLSLPHAAAIGMGTMVGAGIFVFPGMAAGKAGFAATFSFAIGAFVALLVALPCAELATAMPRSGGGYFFISRGLGARFGALVGISLWWGLIFASAFYLAGFGHYFADLLERTAGISPDHVVVFAAAAGVGLTAINVLGTEKSGQFQNIVVSVLLAILTIIIGYGLVQVAGPNEAFESPEQFAPFGALPVITTASLVFTSYLGFAQVANVAGEIKRPKRNLPTAMIGSVVVVALLYVGTITIATASFSPAELQSFGETAMVEVGDKLFGVPGVIAILGAGLLATLSSANASMLSSSRSIYALGRDDLLPKRASSVNKRFGTPHYSIIGAGIPIVGLTLLGEVEMLAEVASFLHLVMYGLLCVTVLWLRHDNPDWYQPTFRTPGHPVVPIVGALGSFAVIAFMNLTTILIGIGVLVAAAGWHFIYARDIELKGALND